MLFEEFLFKLNEINYGVVSFNTYITHSVEHGYHYCYYLMVARKGSSGQFYKAEGEVKNMDALLNNLFKQVTAKKEG